MHDEVFGTPRTPYQRYHPSNFHVVSNTIMHTKLYENYPQNCEDLWRNSFNRRHRKMKLVSQKVQINRCLRLNW